MSSNQETAAVSLPNDVTACHEIIKGLLASLDEKDQRIANLEAAMDALIRQRYAPKRERYVDPDQQRLFDEPGEIAEPPEPSDEDNDDSSGKKKRGGGKGRRLLDENVPREDLLHKLTAEQKVCPKCGAPLVIVLVDGLLQWAHRPAEIYGIQHVHEKGFCQCCHEHVVVAGKPPQMIEKGAADASLLAHLTTSNKGDHLPTYRYEEISLRHGWWLPRSTQVGWLTQTAVTAVILYSWMASRVLGGKLLGTDATGVRVLEPGTGQTQKGTVWVYCGQREVCPYLVYEYTRSGDGEAPRRFLDGYAGYLQADAASVFDQLYRGGTIFEVACGAHMRRYFYKARHSAPLEAHRALGYFRQLYMLERELAAAADDERRALRQQQAMPILDEFKAWLDALTPMVVPKTEIATAVGYALNQWDAFVRYWCPSGKAAISDSAAGWASERSDPVEPAVAGAFGGFQAVAQVDQFVLHGAAVHVVDGDAQVTDQPFKFKGVDRYRFDCLAGLTSLERLFDTIERITVLHDKGAFFRGQFDLDDVAIHRRSPCTGPVKRGTSTDASIAVSCERTIACGRLARMPGQDHLEAVLHAAR